MAVGAKLLCLVIATVLFVVAAVWAPPNPPKFNLLAAGLAFLSLSFLVP